MAKQSDLDNHANQLNPTHETYWRSRGEDERPEDWEDRADERELAKVEQTKQER